jgi:YHS domain-containing protein
MRLLLIAVLFAFVGAGVLLWASGNHEGRINTDAAGVAIDWYDPVAYFTRGEPVQGSPDHAYQWNGVTWHFASAEHRDRFISDPEAYAPAYGGYCAWAVAEGKVAGINPAMWHIENGTLYLNYSAGTNRRFLSDVSGNIARADTNWPNIRSRLDAKASE